MSGDYENTVAIIDGASCCDTCKNKPDCTNVEAEFLPDLAVCDEGKRVCCQSYEPVKLPKYAYGVVIHDWNTEKFKVVSDHPISDDEFNRYFNDIARLGCTAKGTPLDGVTIQRLPEHHDSSGSMIDVDIIKRK